MEPEKIYNTQSKRYLAFMVHNIINYYHKVIILKKINYIHQKKLLKMYLKRVCLKKVYLKKFL